MSYLHPLISALLFLSMATAVAQPVVIKSSPNQTPVLELYTSEGCSSCPPADRLLSEIIKLPKQDLDVLALAFHVDYWDYIGWKDPFASPQFTNRQRMLARANRQSSIYTPEFLLNDQEVRGTRNIVKKIRQSNRQPSTAQFELIADQLSGNIELKLNQVGSIQDDFTVEFIVFENSLSSQVDAGENAGSRLQHQQVVRYLSEPLQLSTTINHQIKINPLWNTQKLGIAAIIRSEQKGFMQSLHSLL